MILPRCANPEIDDYPPWLLSATKESLSQIMDGASLDDARKVLLAIDAAMFFREMPHDQSDGLPHINRNE